MEPELKRSGLRSLYLFGSRARGDHRPDSDVDLAFDADRHGVDLWERAELLALLSEQLGQQVDLVDRAALHARVRPFVEPDLVRVF